MPRKKKGDQADELGATPKKKKSNVLPAAVIAIGLVLGAKMMGGGSGAATAGTPTTTTTTVQPDGPVTKLDPITLNLADGRFLRVGIALQQALGEGHEAAVEPNSKDPSGHYAKALDIVIRVLGRRTYPELVPSEGRNEAKAEVVARLKEAYPEDLVDLYFTEFVLQ